MTNNLNKTLKKVNEADYGKDFKNHYLEQYKLYVEMADRISTRRQSANSFFLTVNTAVITIIGYVQLGKNLNSNISFYWLVSIAGMALCFTWYRLILSYKNLNSGKFKVIHAIEQNLPLAAYDAEWESLEKGKNPKLYKPFTKVEMTVPWIFFILHFSVLLQVIPWKFIIGIFCNQ